MALEPSILKSTKKTLGLDPEYDAFDQDVMTHINTAFFTLNQLGVGPSDGFSIEDADAVWDDFFAGYRQLHAAKTYVYLRVRLLFDPPANPRHIQAFEEQIDELEIRLKLETELGSWAK